MSKPEYPESGLRMSSQLAFEPSEIPGPERHRATRLWHAVQASPEDVLTERADIEKMDRALLQLRKQVLSARSEVDAAKAQVAEVHARRYPAAAVWGLAGLAVFAGAGWLVERRRRVAAEKTVTPSLSWLPATPQAFPPAVEPMGISDFLPSDAVAKTSQ